MLRRDDGIAGISQTVKKRQEMADITGVKARCGLIHQVEAFFIGGGLDQFLGQPKPLAFAAGQGGKGLPLRYNNDKQKKPLFSRGLSVCRLLFNSFSKLKIDENYKEKRRLFY